MIDFADADAVDVDADAEAVGADARHFRTFHIWFNFQQTTEYRKLSTPPFQVFPNSKNLSEAGH